MGPPRTPANPVGSTYSSGHSEISKTTVANILRRNGLPPSPERGGLTWREFLSRHADVFVCADLFTKEIWTLKGLQTAFVFFVLHLQTRRILIARATFSPDGQWLKQQARHVLWAREEQGVEARFFLRDNDRCYADDFDTMLRGSGVDPIHTPYAAPNANAFAECWIRSLRQECLDHLVIFGLSRLQHVINEYRRFYDGHRPHQGIDNRIPDRCTEPPGGLLLPASKSGLRSGDIQCQHFLGGLLKSSFRRAA